MNYINQKNLQAYAPRILFGLGLWLALFFTVPGFNFATPTAILTGILVLYAVPTGAIFWALCRKWPDFLVLPAGRSLLKMIGLFILFWPVFFLILLVPFGLAGYIEVRFIWKEPDHSQDGLHIIVTALWYSFWWAFLPALLVTWKRMQGKRKP